MAEEILNPDSFTDEKRYSYSSFVVDGQGLFSKKAYQLEMVPLLQNELLWHDFMQQVTSTFPGLRLRSPRVIEEKDDEIIFEHIEAPFVSSPDDKIIHDHDIERLASVLIALDQVAGGWSSAHAVDDANNNLPYDNLSFSWEDWYKETKPAGLVTEEMMRQAKSLLAQYAACVTPRLQHGDFTPWHIFDQGGEWIIYDGEHASQMKPRFFDLAYLYSRIFTRQKNAEAAGRILQNFVGKIDMDEDDFFKAFLPLLVSRSLGMFLDALHDKKSVDYTLEAKNLYKLCVARDINLLLRAE